MILELTWTERQWIFCCLMGVRFSASQLNSHVRPNCSVDNVHFDKRGSSGTSCISKSHNSLILSSMSSSTKPGRAILTAWLSAKGSSSLHQGCQSQMQSQMPSDTLLPQATQYQQGAGASWGTHPSSKSAPARWISRASTGVCGCGPPTWGTPAPGAHPPPAQRCSPATATLAAGRPCHCCTRRRCARPAMLHGGAASVLALLQVLLHDSAQLRRLAQAYGCHDRHEIAHVHSQDM